MALQFLLEGPLVKDNLRIKIYPHFKLCLYFLKRFCYNRTDFFFQLSIRKQVCLKGVCVRNLVLLKILNSHFYSLSSLIIAKKIEFLFPQNSFLAIFSLYRAKFGQMSLDGKKKFFCFIFSPFFSLNTPVKKVSFMNKIKI